MSDWCVTHLLRDGREMLIREADVDDAIAIASAFPLPEQLLAREDVYRSYFRLKTLIYVRAQCAGITCGFVDAELAGYQFYCRDLSALRGYTMSASNALWLARQILRGGIGYGPRFWLACIRWGLQHFRQPGEYADADPSVLDECSTLETWSRGVRTAAGFQRLGIASTLMRHTEEKLAAEGARSIALWTAADNAAAIGLFEKMGFQKRGKMRRIGESCWLMVKEISAARD